MIRIRRRGLTSKLFSLIGGVTTGLVITMAVVIPMPGKRVPVLMTHSGPPAVSRAFEAKDLPDQTPAVVQDDQADHCCPSLRATPPDTSGPCLHTSTRNRATRPDRQEHRPSGADKTRYTQQGHASARPGVGARQCLLTQVPSPRRLGQQSPQT